MFFAGRDFFLLGGRKTDSFAPQGEIKCTLWPVSRKINFLTPRTKKKVCNTGITLILLVWLFPSLYSSFKLYTYKINLFSLDAINCHRLLDRAELLNFCIDVFINHVYCCEKVVGHLFLTFHIKVSNL